MFKTILTNTSTLKLTVLAAGFLCVSLAAGSAFADVCSEGVGIPPFLSAGAQPNMLFAIDNSGSMLDLAYVDKQSHTTAAGNTYQSTCFDEFYSTDDDGTFNAAKTYAGYFDAGQWYLWVEPIGWETATVYATGAIVSSNGKLYVAECAAAPCTSTGTMLDDDTGLTWAELGPDTVNEWSNAQNYVTGDIVIFNGMLFQATEAVPLDVTLFTPLDQRNSGTDAWLWNRLDEGYFEAQSAEPCATPSFYYLNAAGTADERKDVKITFDDPTTPTAVTCFGARGNFLNWASASKFDIQKQVFTGGKFYAGDEATDGAGNIDNTDISDTDDDRLVSESRGCSGKGFIKQITLNRDASDNVVSQNLVLKVRGPVDGEDKLDGSDFITRIEIVGASASGVNFERCADYIELVEAGGPANAEMTSAFEDCMYASNPVQAVASIFHAALHDCWKFGRGQDPVHSGSLRAQCEFMYTGGSQGTTIYPQVDPWNISPWDPYYICFGQWDNIDPPTAANDYHGTGFVGRCWEDWPVSGTGIVCVQKTCDVTDGTWVDSGNKGFWKNDTSGVGQQCNYGLQFKCEDGGSVDTTDNNPTCSGPGEKLTIAFVDQADNTTVCDPTTSLTTANDCETTGGCFAFGAPGSDPCVLQAEIDYCNSITVPEVIDPTDLPPGSDGTVWGIGAAIIDAGVYAQMGVDEPLMIMKGYVKYELPTEQTTDDPGRPDGPRGVLFDKAALLKIGVMAFRDNGSKTECDNFAAICTRDADNKFDVCVADDTSADCAYCTARQSIEKYCPDPNYDGAEIIAPVKTPWTTGATMENWDHYNSIITGINTAQATSWTPLAEAMFTAIGYFGQNIDMCINQDASVPGGCADFPISAADDPVEFWCQDNHVLFITEGASTADINQEVMDYVADAELNAFNNAPTPVLLGSDTDLAVDATCISGLEGSTFLDDLTYYALNANADKTLGGFYATPQLNSEDKQNITTHIISTGSVAPAAAGADECTPAIIMENAATNGGGTYLNAEDPGEIRGRFDNIVSDILGRASAGSAASVISSSRSGSGAVYQAIFWPELRDSPSNTNVEWIGDVHALFLDENGFLYEDRTQDGILEPSADEGADGLDRRLVFFFNENAGRSMACYRIAAYFASDPFTCPNAPTNKDQVCNNTDCAELQDINYLWSVKNWLADIDTEAAIPRPDETNRDPYMLDLAGNFENKRYIFTWNDLNNNGMVEAAEVLPFTAGALVDAALPVTPDPLNDPYYGANHPRGSVVDDFGINDTSSINRFVAGDLGNKNDAVKTLINWVRGIDYLTNEDAPANDNVADLVTEDLNGNGRVEKNLRSRDFPINGVLKTWRLGDVIHSTPTVVAKPPEAYHFIYKDPTYALFADRYAKRRQVVYFGANDGMMHAINAGFYNEGTNTFCKTLKDPADYRADLQDADPTNDTPCIDIGAPLGAELWGYIPYNLVPHLSCMADPEYDHKFFVDQRPRIFDAQIFPDDCDYSSGVDCSAATHPGGWGTVMVGSMRFGGSDVAAHTLNGLDGIPAGEGVDERHFGSSYFILDITNPELPPTLMGEMTMLTDSDSSGNRVTTDLAYTTPSPTVAVMRYEAGNALGLPEGATRWHLIFGNGPEELDGTNNQRGKIAIYPMEYLQGAASNWSWNSVTTPEIFSPKFPLDTSTKKPFRIPDLQPGTAGARQSGYEAGIYHVPGSGNQPSFISDLITVDFDIEGQTSGTLGGLYRADAIYFGTVDGNMFVPDGSGGTEWNGGGRLFRMVTKYMSGATEIASEPNEWNDAGSAAGDSYQTWSNTYGDTTATLLNTPVLLTDGTTTNDISSWIQPHNMLIDAKGPIVGAPAVGWDGNTFWVYFGTGRFFDKLDKTDSKTQRFFGIREPFDLSGTLTCYDQRMDWSTLGWDLATNTLGDEDPALSPGFRGLLQTDNIIVAEYASSIYDVPFLECNHCVEDENDSEGDGDYVTCDNLLTAADCFPAALPLTSVPDPVDPINNPAVDVYVFDDLNKYISGTSCNTGIDGWFREVHEPRERHLGQAALLGGLLTYTSYKPFSDVCKSEGRSFLYGIHYQTGTAWYESVFGTYASSGSTFVKEKLSLGRGLATTPSLHVGAGENAATAFVQTSTGEIIEIGQENLPLVNVKSGRASWSDETN